MLAWINNGRILAYDDDDDDDDDVLRDLRLKKFNDFF